MRGVPGRSSRTGRPPLQRPRRGLALHRPRCRLPIARGRLRRPLATPRPMRGHSRPRSCPCRALRGPRGPCPPRRCAVVRVLAHGACAAARRRGRAPPGLPSTPHLRGVESAKKEGGLAAALFPLAGGGPCRASRDRLAPPLICRSYRNSEIGYKGVCRSNTPLYPSVAYAAGSTPPLRASASRFASHVMDCIKSLMWRPPPPTRTRYQSRRFSLAYLLSDA